MYPKKKSVIREKKEIESHLVWIRDEYRKKPFQVGVEFIYQTNNKENGGCSIAPNLIKDRIMY